MGHIKENFYELLEIDKNADFGEIKASYKKLVRKFHPDVNKSKDAELRFKLINNAYKVLSDVKQKQEYDEFILRNRPKKTPDKNSIIKEIIISEYEQKEGTVRTVNILNTKICPKCGGRKYIKGVKCPFCLGEGKKSEHKKIEVKIENDIEAGEYIYVGNISDSQFSKKELFLKVQISKAQKMFVENGDIVFPITLPVYDVILGVEKEINVHNLGVKKIKIPPYSAPFNKIKLNFKYENKDCYAQIEVIFPKTVSNEEKNLYDRIRKIDLERKNVR